MADKTFERKGSISPNPSPSLISSGTPPGQSTAHTEFGLDLLISPQGTPSDRNVGCMRRENYYSSAFLLLWRHKFKKA